MAHPLFNHTPHKPTGLGAPATGFTHGSSHHCLFSSPQEPSPTLSPEGRISITHWASNVGRVVDTGGPFVSAVTVCGDEPVLLSISGAAIDLVFPAWLRRTFYPRATRKKEVIFIGNKPSCPLEYQLNTKYFLSTYDMLATVGNTPQDKNNVQGTVSAHCLPGQTTVTHKEQQRTIQGNIYS